MVGKANESEIFINDFRSKALIDSGSMISTISSSVLNRLKPVPEIKDLSNLGLTVNVAGGATLPYLGYVEVKIKVNFISSEDIFVPLLVVNATEYNKNVPVVVGTNIIKDLSSVYVQRSWKRSSERVEFSFQIYDRSSHWQS